ncbi:MAG: hypothetical protein GY828_03460, partial [Candidatus Gracilibacteria bacterium]|nr:hypothetical protein [Candidatus Gracilibacteria bacterium]
CVVVAKPLSSCENDGSDGDPGSIGFPSASSGGGRGSSNNTNGNNGGKFSGNGGGNSQTNSQGDQVSFQGFSILNANCSPGKGTNATLTPELVQEYLNYKNTGIESATFKDVFKHSLGSTGGARKGSQNPNMNEPLIEFNGQSMDDEISANIDFSTGKEGDYTDVIKVENRRISPFPDFLMEWVTKQIEEIVTKLTDFPTVFIILPNFDGILDYGSSEYDNPKKEVNSGIEEAYKFLSSLPLISIEQETLSIELPWIEEAERKAAVQKWSNTVDQWKKEVKRAGESWSLGATCKEGDTVCEENNAASAKILVDAEALISSLERNIEVLEDYREFPKKVGELVRKKEDYLEQILCNVESISEILGGWIGLNGERFNAWVELYILIKAILKSWQGLIDVFVDYEAECHECKNERGDLQTFIWKLISVVIPEIPVIQFPKWPDIILDLHHIRAGLVITLPEFTFGTRPIILPNLPNLYLPDAPNVNIVLPSLPVLPTIDLPELPDLPVLPTVELPNLPPPPTLPKMFASLEEVLEILKVITKAMCILKTSPFTPEWKAGDQIAFLTERQGYLDMDFIDLSLPQYSYSHVDAIKVTSYVNLEFETEFVTELARQITMPLTTFTNDFSTILNIGVDDLDFTLLPTDIDIHLDGNVEVGSHQQDQIMQFAMYMAKGVGKAAGFMEMNKDVTVSNSEFKLLVAEALSSDVFISHPKYNEFRNIWDPVFAYNFEREEKIISDLQKNNFEKFETLKNILHTEILQNRELLKNLDQELQPDFMKKVVGEGGDDIEIYNKELAVYNKKFIDSAHDLMYGNGNEMQNDLAQRGDDLLDRVQSPLKRYQDAQKHISMNGGTQKPKHPIAASACQEQAESEYKFNYEGLYTIENRGGKDHSYRLFDYLNELDGKEEITQIDVDGDGDDDILYKVGDELYLKENLNFEPIRIHDDVKIITPEVNKFYDEDIDYTAVDGLREGFVDNDYLNAIFSASTREDISSYRLEFSGLVDRTTDRVSLVDTFADIENITYIDDGELFIARKNLSYITNAGILKNIEMTTKPFRNIKDDIRDGKVVDISSDTTIYADSGKVRLTYMKKGSTEEKIITIPAYQNLHVKRSIKIIGIHGNAYIAGPYDTTLRGEEIRSYIGMPLLPGSHIRHTGNNIPDKFSFVDIEYYDNGSNRFRWDKIKEYWLYDIGAKAEKYSITLNTENDYLYANIRSFKENLFSTYSKQIVLAPQTVADNYAPEFYLESIKIPVYQKQNIDLTDFIFDEGGIKGLKKIEIDMDLQKDSNGDGDTKNDSDIPESNIKKTLIQLGIEIGPFDTLRNDSIGISFTDSNNNKGFFEIPFEVYAPVPEIDRLNTQGFIGEINEKLDNEPISLFRYRGGKITQIEDETGEDTVLTQSGSYNFKVNEESQGLTLEYQGSKIADISEKTGKISLLDYFSSIRMYPSSHPKNNDFYPTIQILKDSKVIYYQYLNISNVTSVTPVESFDTIADPGIYVQFSNSEIYGFYNIPETVTYNPGAVIIHKLQDTQKTPLFILYPDGRIETLNDFYKLEYDTYNEFISVKLINKNSNTEVAKVLFYIDGGYIMR